MVREEDIEIVQRLSEQFGRPVEAFYVYWDSGLFSEALKLIEGNDLVRDVVWPDHPNKYEGDIGAEFELCKKLSQLGLWGRSKERMNLLYLVNSCADTVLNGVYDNRPLANIILGGEAGLEKHLIAMAIHKLCKRKNFQVIDFTKNDQDVEQMIESCQFGGTVYFNNFDKLSNGVRTWHLQVINQHRLLKEIKTNDQVVTEIQDLDTLFIIGLDPAPRNTKSIIEKLVCQIPPLAKRRTDIALLINQILLGVGQNDLDKARHCLAVNLFTFYSKRRPVGNVGWLKGEVGRWLREFFSDTRLSEGTQVSISGTEKTFSHSDDYTSIWLGETNFRLTSRQASVVIALHKARNYELTEDYILVSILENGPGQGRLRDTFKSRPGYLGGPGDTNALIVKVEGIRNPVRYRLNI